jgi:hypothetical protein
MHMQGRGGAAGGDVETLRTAGSLSVVHKDMCHL